MDCWIYIAHVNASKPANENLSALQSGIWHCIDKYFLEDE